MEKGELIPESIVLDALLCEIFDPARNDGIGMIIDGKRSHLPQPYFDLTVS